MGQRIMPGNALTLQDKLNLARPITGEEDVLAGIKELLAQTKDKQALEDENLMGLRDKIDQFENKEPEINLNAGLALVDTLTGSNLTAKIKDKSLSEDERQAEGINMRNSLLERLDKIRSGKEKNLQDLQMELLGQRNNRDIQQSKNIIDQLTAQNKINAEKAEKDAKPSKTQDLVDKKFGEEFVKYELLGGAADSDKSISNLESVLEKLNDEKVGNRITGPAVGAALKSGAVGEGLVSVFNQEAKDAQDLVQSSILGQIKESVGGNPSQQESFKILGFSYDPSLGREANQKRLSNTVNALKKAREAKRKSIEYFKENGTMKGYDGKLFTIDDLKKEIGMKEDGKDKKLSVDEMKARREELLNKDKE